MVTSVPACHPERSAAQPRNLPIARRFRDRHTTHDPGRLPSRQLVLRSRALARRKSLGTLGLTARIPLPTSRFPPLVSHFSSPRYTAPMTERTLRAGVIGLGAMGANHARVYGDMPGIELAAVADTDAARIEAGDAQVAPPVATATTAACCTRRRSTSSRSAVPTRAHLARRLRRDRRRRTGARREAARRHNRRGRAPPRPRRAHVGADDRRPHRALQPRRHRAEAPPRSRTRPGRVFQVHARRVGPFPERVRDVGVVLDLAPHDIDVMRFLLGSEIARVQAETEQRINTEHEDMLFGLLRFANGVVGVLDVNWLTPTKIRELSVLGERGMFVVDYLARELTFYENAHPHEAAGDWAARHLKGVSEGPVHVVKVDKREPLRVELESFARAVRSARRPPCRRDDGIAAMAAAEALVRAARTGEHVTLPWSPPRSDGRAGQRLRRRARKIGIPLAVQFASKGAQRRRLRHQRRARRRDQREAQPARAASPASTTPSRARRIRRPARHDGCARRRRGCRRRHPHRPGRHRCRAPPRLRIARCRGRRHRSARRRGALVIVETTVPVGTTRSRVGAQIAAASGLAAGDGFALAFSPERVSSGRVLRDLATYPKIVGGIDAASAERAERFYSSMLDAEVLVVRDAETAEFSKLAETTYRDVNIALANEFARIADRLGVDALQAIEAANSQPYSHIHAPGPGVGGHCIPVYPYFLDPAEGGIITAARALNDDMARYSVSRLSDAIGGLKRATCVVLGLSVPPRREGVPPQQRLRPRRCPHRRRREALRPRPHVHARRDPRRGPRAAAILPAPRRCARGSGLAARIRRPRPRGLPRPPRHPRPPRRPRFRARTRSRHHLRRPRLLSSCPSGQARAIDGVHALM